MNQTVSKNLCQYFEEDLVCRISKNGLLEVGSVVESTEDNDSDDDEEEEEESVSPKLQPGHAKVAWYPKGNAHVVKEKKVDLFDRSLLSGDVVKRLNVNGGQRGLVCNTKVDLVCKIVGTKQVVTGVTSDDFVDGIDLSEDILFYYNDWVGIIEEIKCNVILSLPDGSSVKMTEDELLNFKDITNGRSRNCEFDDSFPYLGQQVVVPASWLPMCKFVTLSEGSSFGNNVVMTVIQIQVDSIQAHWVCCISSANDIIVNEVKSLLAVRPPNIVIRGDYLKQVVPLDYFKRGSLEMGDRGLITLKEDHTVMLYNEWSLQAAKQHRGQKLGNLSESHPMSAGDVKNVDDEEYVDISSDDDESMQVDTSSNPSNESFRWRRPKVGVSIKKIRSKYLKPSKNLNLPRKPIHFSPGSHIPVEVVVTKGIVDILWQDGTIERECPSTDFYPIHHLDGHEYFPGDYVVKAKTEFSHNLYGVIQSVDHSERTANVKWLEVSGNEKPKFVSEQEVSVYDLEDHPDFNFRPGSCVARLITSATENLSPAARAGQVVSLKTSGSIDCVWADGSRCDVDPQDLYLIGDYDDEDLWGDNDDSDDSDDFEFPARSREPKTPPLKCPLSGSPKTPGSERELIDRLRKSVDDLEDWFNQYPTLNNQNAHIVVRKLTTLLENLEAVDSRMNTSLTTLKAVQTLIESVRLPENISGRTANINRKLSKLIKSILKKGSVSPMETESDEMALDSATGGAESSPISTKTRVSLEILYKLKAQLFAICPSNERENKEENGTVEEGKSSKEPSATNTSFQHVDHVPDTHKFKLSIFQAANPRPFFTRVQKEINLLRNSLPQDILVKGFEDRMDLFSVLIKGPKDTPYEDGLFLFDVQLPAGYPNVPPLVHYIPFCRDRLNPNLYESGKVCVSLLGTWSGKGSEVWSPVESTLLQLFISIQGLILVPEPYFNEAGYTRQKGTSSGDENSRLYNEMAVVKVVESMTRMTSSPPEPFREEISSHVKGTAESFIIRLESWIKVSRSTESVEDIGKLAQFPLLPASKGFCLSLTSALQSFRHVLSSLE